MIEIVSTMQRLSRDSQELAEIRATLLVNFGVGKRLDLQIEDNKQSTFLMLFEVLEKLTKDNI